MVMMMVTRKTDHILGNWVLTRCVWGDILDQRYYCCHCGYHVVIFLFVLDFVSVFGLLFSGAMRAHPLSAEVSMRSGVEP